MNNNNEQYFYSIYYISVTVNLNIFINQDTSVC